MRLARQCVGCEEASGIRHEPELGQVCESCVEVLDIVEQSIDSVRCGLGSTTRSFECVSREPSTNPDLTFTKWVLR